MKNATKYEKEFRKLLQSLPKARGKPPEEEGPVRLLVRGVLETDATPGDAERGLERLSAEFVDFNELRVAPVREIVDCLGKQSPTPRAKGETLRAALRHLFERTGDVNMAPLEDLSKRELRRRLKEMGLDTYSVAYVTLYAFGGHAVPVDRNLVDCLQAEKCVHPDSDLADVQGFLERIVPQKDAVHTHLRLRAYVEKNAKLLEKIRREREQAQQKVREQEQAEAEKAAAKKASKKSRKPGKPAGKAKKATASGKAGSKGSSGSGSAAKTSAQKSAKKASARKKAKKGKRATRKASGKSKKSQSQ